MAQGSASLDRFLLNVGTNELIFGQIMPLLTFFVQ